MRKSSSSQKQSTQNLIADITNSKCCKANNKFDYDIAPWAPFFGSPGGKFAGDSACRRYNALFEFLF